MTDKFYFRPQRYRLMQTLYILRKAEAIIGKLYFFCGVMLFPRLSDVKIKLMTGIQKNDGRIKSSNNHPYYSESNLLTLLPLTMQICNTISSVRVFIHSESLLST